MPQVLDRPVSAPEQIENMQGERPAEVSKSSQNMPAGPDLDRGEGALLKKADKLAWQNATPEEFADFSKYVERLLWQKFKISDQDLVTNVVGDSFTKIANNLDPDRLTDGGVRAFANTVIWNSARDQLRRENSHGWAKIRLTGGFEASSAWGRGEEDVLSGLTIPHRIIDSTPLDIAANREEIDTLRAAISSLETPVLKAIGEAMIEGAEGTTEIAERTGRSLSATKIGRKELFRVLSGALKREAS